MLKRTFMILVLPLLFLFAQQGAITHEISHFTEPAPLNQQKQQSPHSPICDQCVSYEEMAGALNSPNFHHPVILTTAIQLDGFQYVSSHQVVIPRQARAPPTNS